MRRRTFVLIGCLFLILTPPVPAEPLDAYRQLQEWAPYVTAERDKLYSLTQYEFSRINQGSRKLEWNFFTERLFYRTEKWLPYVEIAHHDRDRRMDYTLDGGAVYIAENWNLKGEIGFGMDTDFIYRFQTTTEMERRLVKSLFGKWKLRYLHYELSDVLVASPAGVIYYYGDHYFTLDYNFSVTESRGDAHFATAKAHFVLHPRFHVYTGTALGERLFDIFPEKAQKQESFILFTGADIRLNPNLQVSVGYSYSEEKPSFVKRSVNASITVKF